jgi:hypothetical protein
MTIAEAKNALPLPALLRREGLGSTRRKARNARFTLTGATRFRSGKGMVHGSGNNSRVVARQGCR